MTHGRVRIGLSGWRYPPWRGAFYPRGLVQRKELAYAAQAMASIEINGSFYSLQRPGTWAEWFHDTPDDFVFSIKGPKLITHLRRLVDIELPLANFLASGLLQLRQKLGPILWQFPPQLAFDPARFEPFLAGLPRDTDQARAIAKSHDAHMASSTWLGPVPTQPMRHAVEVRHTSFLCEDFIHLLREYQVALVVADSAKRFPETFDVTADFVYIRLHGSTELYRSGYDDAELTQWGDRIRSWSQGAHPNDVPLLGAKPPGRARRDVYCYFDNTDKMKAPGDAMKLAEQLGVTPAAPASLWD